jgi:hypothetical protein
MAGLETTLFHAALEHFEAVVSGLLEAIEVLVKFENEVLFVESFEPKSMGKLQEDVNIKICLRVCQREVNGSRL